MKRLRPIGQGRFRRNRSEAELQETRALLDAALDHAPLVFYAKDGEGRFTVVNAEFERIAGRPRGEIVGRTGEDLLPVEDGERFSAHERESVEAGRDRAVRGGRRRPHLRVAALRRSPAATAPRRGRHLDRRDRAPPRGGALPARVRGGADRDGADVARRPLPARQRRAVRDHGLRRRRAGGHLRRRDHPSRRPRLLAARPPPGGRRGRRGLPVRQALHHRRRPHGERPDARRRRARRRGPARTTCSPRSRTSRSASASRSSCSSWPTTTR